MQFIVMFITSPFRIQRLIMLQANRCQSTFGFDAGIFGAPQGYLCRNDWKIDGDCNSGIVVKEYGDYCESCQARGYPPRKG